MKVGSLFAEIGFTVNDSGLNKFSKAMDSFHKQISSGLKDLRLYAKAARDISKAMKDAYTPNRSEAKARYLAETQRILVQTKLAAIRAKKFEQDSNTRALNAASRAKQVELKEKGLSEKNGRGSRMEAILRSLAMLSRNTIFSSLGGVIGALFSPMGSIIGSHIGKMADKIVSGIFRATSLLGKTIISGMKFGMAYRDYRNFTGRSTSSLGGLMARTFNTTNMSPEDVLRDAAKLESNYWGMILGQGNPALWQLLGVSPTGMGEIDLENLIERIGDITNGFENRGLARYLFKLADLDEDYLNMQLDKSEGEIDVDAFLEGSKEWEKINKELRLFEFEFKKFKMSLAQAFSESGLLDTIKQALIDLAQSLPDIVQMFKDLFVVLKNFVEWLKLEFPGVFGSNKSWAEQSEDRWARSIKKGENPVWFGIKEAVVHPIDTAALAGEAMANLNARLERQNIQTAQNMRNVFNSVFNVGSADEAISINAENMRNANNTFKQSGQSFQGQINDSFNQLKW